MKNIIKLCRYLLCFGSGLLQVLQSGGEKSQRPFLMHLTVSLQAWKTSLGRRKVSLFSFWMSFYTRQRYVDLSPAFFLLSRSFTCFQLSSSPYCASMLLSLFFNQVKYLKYIYEVVFEVFCNCVLYFMSPHLRTGATDMRCFVFRDCHIG